MGLNVLTTMWILTLAIILITMLGGLEIVHVNTHSSMLESIRRITKERVYNTIRLVNEALRKMGIEKPE